MNYIGVGERIRGVRSGGVEKYRPTNELRAYRNHSTDTRIARTAGIGVATGVCYEGTRTSDCLPLFLGAFVASVPDSLDGFAGRWCVTHVFQRLLLCHRATR